MPHYPADATKRQQQAKRTRTWSKTTRLEQMWRPWEAKTRKRLLNKDKRQPTPRTARDNSPTNTRIRAYLTKSWATLCCQTNLSMVTILVGGVNSQALILSERQPSKGTKLRTLLAVSLKITFKQLLIRLMTADRTLRLSQLRTFWIRRLKLLESMVAAALIILLTRTTWKYRICLSKRQQLLLAKHLEPKSTVSHTWPRWLSTSKPPVQ